LFTGRTQLLTVPACQQCHGNFSDDDAHFRNVLPLCGEYPPALIRELWEGGVLRALDASDGNRRVSDLLNMIETDSDGKSRIWPERNQSFMAVLHRFVRAICWYHNYGWPVAEERVNVERLAYQIPSGYLTSVPGGASPGELLRWSFAARPEDGDGAASVLLLLRDNMRFLGMVEPRK